MVITATVTQEADGHLVDLKETPDLGMVIGTQPIADAARSYLNIHVLQAAEGTGREQEAPTTPTAGAKGPLPQEEEGQRVFRLCTKNKKATMTDLNNHPLKAEAVEWAKMGYIQGVRLLGRSKVLRAEAKD